MVKIINDSVCRGVAGKRTNKVKGVVPHNTWDNQTVEYHRNRLKNMTASQLEKGFAHYYIDATTIGRFEDTFNGAWHVANYDGNMNYLGYEIVADRSTSKTDLLQAEQNACWQMAQDLKYYGLPVNRDSVKLHHEFSATECPKRSLIEHCGYDSTLEVPQDVTNKMKDYYIKEIKKYYDNPNLKPDGGATVAKVTNNRPRHKVVSEYYKKDSESLQELRAYLKKENLKYTEKIAKDGRISVIVSSFSQNSSNKYKLEQWLGDRNLNYFVTHA